MKDRSKRERHLIDEKDLGVNVYTIWKSEREGTDGWTESIKV